MIIPFPGLAPGDGRCLRCRIYSNRLVAIVWQPIGCVKRAVPGTGTGKRGVGEDGQCVARRSTVTLHAEGADTYTQRTIRGPVLSQDRGTGISLHDMPPGAAQIVVSRR